MVDSRPTSEPRALWIDGPAGRLEAVLRAGAGSPVGAAVLAHPHPLHGGTLHNPVIFHADRELSRAGWITLRFNFRGVGSSDGVHDEGRGEVDDVGAAVSWLRGLAGTLPLIVVGFSFGSWCGIRWAAQDPAVGAVVAIGLPSRLYPFAEIEALRRPMGIVQAEHDQFGSPAELEALIRDSRALAKLRVIEGTTHLFPGIARRAGEAVAELAGWCVAVAGTPVRGD